jgi:hypothetical protein
VRKGKVFREKESKNTRGGGEDSVKKRMKKFLNLACGIFLFLF